MFVFISYLHTLVDRTDERSRERRQHEQINICEKIVFHTLCSRFPQSGASGTQDTTQGDQAFQEDGDDDLYS